MVFSPCRSRPPRVQLFAVDESGTALASGRRMRDLNGKFMNRMGLLLPILGIGVSSDSGQIPRGNDSRGRVGVLPFSCAKGATV
jgi:hypothetical protein